MDKAIVDLAVLIKQNSKGNANGGFIIGKVIAPPPSLQVSIDEAIILDNSHLILAAHVLNNYERQCEFTINGSVSSGKVKWLDSLKVDDLVILIPASNMQSYILIDKAVEL